jgi:large subunit ribosomal protein L24
MQKVLQRTARAKFRAEKRRVNELPFGREKIDEQIYANVRPDTNAKDQISRADRGFRNNVREARLARREDWEMGPLAPKRDVGEHADTYGAIKDVTTFGGLRSKQKEKMWNGGQIFRWPIAEGDRVVMLGGPDEGRIGTVMSLIHDRNMVKVKGLNQVSSNCPSPLFISFRRRQMCESPCDEENRGFCLRLRSMIDF